MPGILQPEQSDIRPSTDTPNVAPSAGLAGATAALAGIGDLLGAIPRTTERRPTAKEDAREVLLPLSQQLRKLDALKRSGEATRYNVRVRTALTNFVATHPEYEDEARSLVETQTGKTLDILNPTEPSDALTTGMNEFLGTSAGQIAALQSVVYNDDGSVNNNATRVGLQEAFYQDLAMKAKAEKVKMRADMSGYALTYAQNSAKLELPLFVSNQYQRSRAIVDNLVKGALVNYDPNNPIDAIQTAGTIRTVMAQVRTQYMDEATASGFSEFTEYDVEKVMEPFNNLLKTLTSSTNAIDDIAELRKGLDAKSAIVLGEALNKVTGAPIGYLDTVQEALGQALGVKYLPDIDKLAETIKTNGENMGLNNIFRADLTPLPSPEPTEQGAKIGEFADPYSDAAKAKAASLTPEQKKQSAKAGFDRFSLFTTSEALTKPGVRKDAVFGLGEALVNVTAEGKVLSGKAIDQVFNEKFFRVYDEIAKYDDEPSTRMQHMVGDFVSKDIQTRLDNLTRYMTEGQDLRTVRLDFNQSGTVSLAIGPGFETSNARGDAEIRRVLQRHGLPLTNEGLQILIESQGKPLGSGPFAVVPHVVVLQEAVRDLGEDSMLVEIQKLNKMLFAAKRLGTVGQVVERKVKDGFDARPVVISSEEEYLGLPDGKPYVLIDEDGKVRDRGTK